MALSFIIYVQGLKYLILYGGRGQKLLETADYPAS